MSIRALTAGVARHLPGSVESTVSSPRLLQAIGAILAAGLLLVGFATAENLHRAAIHDTERNLLSLTTLLAEQADEALRAIELVEIAAANTASGPEVETEQDFIRSASTFAMHDRLKASIAALPQVGEISMVDAAGRRVASSRAWPGDGADLSAEPFFKTLAADAFTRSVIVTPDAEDGVAIRVARRIVGAQGRLLGWSVGRVERPYFEALYARVSPDTADVISIVHSDGTMLARHPCPLGAIGRIVPPLPWMPASMADQRGPGVGRITASIDGQDRIIAAQPLANFPMIIGASRTLTATLLIWHRQVAALGVAIGLLIAGLFALLWTSARQVRAQQKLVRSEAARVAAEEQARGARRLRDEYARFGTALNSMRQGLALFDADGELAVVSARFAELFALPGALRNPGAPLGRMLDHISEAMAAGEGALFVADLRRAIDAAAPASLFCTLANGRIIGMAVSPVAGGGFVCTCEDDTERRQAEAAVAHMARHDPLTGLPNRLLLGEALAELAASPGRQRGAVLLLDLDGFKQVNDGHGHPLGDALLQQVAARLRGLVEAEDTVARLGGDEFAIVRHLDMKAGMACPQSSDAVLLADRIIEAFDAPFTIGALRLAVGTSIGIALVEASDCTPGSLLRDADAALYRAKAAGRRCWCLHAADEISTLDRHAA